MPVPPSELRFLVNTHELGGQPDHIFNGAHIRDCADEAAVLDQVWNQNACPPTQSLLSLVDASFYEVERYSLVHFLVH